MHLKAFGTRKKHPADSGPAQLDTQRNVWREAADTGRYSATNGMSRGAVHAHVLGRGFRHMQSLNASGATCLPCCMAGTRSSPNLALPASSHSPTHE